MNVLTGNLTYRSSLAVLTNTQRCFSLRPLDSHTITLQLYLCLNGVHCNLLMFDNRTFNKTQNRCGYCFVFVLLVFRNHGWYDRRDISLLKFKDALEIIWRLSGIVKCVTNVFSCLKSTLITMSTRNWKTWTERHITHAI